ncbi:MAG TPA: YraN family protein [Lachnospiraceae bacterium]|nr:YraN family protein [Lachnospiraceae bacterium]
MSGKEENKKKGDIGEALAAKILQRKGYTILDKNFRLRTGEIDIIAKQKGYIVFVEVKYRHNIDKGNPSEAVNYLKQQKIIATAKNYIQRKNLYDADFRFDVIEIIGGETPLYRHIENAFGE